MTVNFYQICIKYVLYYSGGLCKEDISGIWLLNIINVDFSFSRIIYRLFSFKIVFFPQFTAIHPLHLEEQLILARDLSVQSLVLADHFLYNQ